MFSTLISHIRSDLKIFTREQKRFSLLVLPCIFLIMAEYGMSCPVSTSLFISHFSAKSLPYVYLFTVPLNLLIVSLYNRFIPKIGAKNSFTYTLAIVSIVHVLCGLYVDKIPYLIFFQFAFRDIYILLLFKQLWSMIHATCDVSKIKYLYSVPFFIGSFGAIVGSIIPSFLAISVGSASIFFFTPVIYLFIVSFYKKAFLLGNSSDTKKLFTSTKGGFSLVRKSKYLVLVLLLVLFMQLAITLVHFQFNYYLEKAFSDVDFRTQYMGRVHFFISSLSITVQITLSAFLIQFLGLKRSHLFVPLALLANSFVFLVKPTLSTISHLYITIKSIDFSFFCLIREKLYAPLSLDEKYRAKAVIDVFVYRSSKAIGSFFLIVFAWQELVYPLIYTLAILLIAWILVVLTLYKEKPEIVHENP